MKKVDKRSWSDGRVPMRWDKESPDTKEQDACESRVQKCNGKCNREQTAFNAS